MKARELSYRGLAEETRRLDAEGRGLTFGYLGHVGRGLQTPPPETIELIAAALEVDPTCFTEYLCLVIAREFNYKLRDPRELERNIDDLLDAFERLPRGTRAGRQPSRLRRRVETLAKGGLPGAAFQSHRAR
jgi:transcriptional regulator with XRE-family HTH domain